MKAGMNTLIAKIGIAVAIVAVIAVGAVFFMKNRGEEEASNVETRDDAQGQMTEIGTGSDAQGQMTESGAGSDAQGQMTEIGTGSDVQGQTADEVLESQDEEINAVVEEEHKQEEEELRTSLLDDPEDVLPYGQYVYEAVYDGEIEMPIWLINPTRSSIPPQYAMVLVFPFDDDVQYEYDAETKQYTIRYTAPPYYRYYSRTSSSWCRCASEFIGRLDEEGNLIITYCEMSDRGGTVVFDDLEWVYVYTTDEKWIEKQNVFNDRLLCDCICYAAGSSEMDPDVLIDLAACQVIKEMQDTEQDIYSLLSGTDKYTEAVKEMLGVSSADELTLRSHNASGVLPVSAIRVKLYMNGCDVWIEGSDASGMQGADPEAVFNISDSIF